MKVEKAQKEFIRMRSEGLDFKQISEELNQNIQTLINWNEELKEEIGNLKSVKLEILYKNNYIQKDSRIELFGGLLKRIKEELDKRDFSEVKTDKLLQLFLKYHDYLNEDDALPIFKDECSIEKSRHYRQLMRF